MKELQELAEEKEFISHDERIQIDELVTQGKFLMAAQALRSAIPPDLLDRLFHDRFQPSDARPGQLHRSLFHLKVPLIITTNYDFLLEDAYAEEYRRSAQNLTYKEAAVVQSLLQRHQQFQDRPSIFKIHGSAHTPGEAILSELDYRQLLYREPGYRMILSAVFVMKVVLMLGFSFEDTEIRLVLESIRDSLKYRSAPDYIVLPKNARNSVERKRWRQDFGIETIEYEPSPGHPELVQLVDFLASHLPLTP